ncbi:MAG: hypothetical protein QXX95_03840 [Nitrososphaerales archaeon]
MEKQSSALKVYLTFSIELLNGMSLKGLKVLHIWNTAGVASIIAKYMDRIYETKSWVIMRKKFDKFGLTSYGECWDTNAKIFTLRALWKAKNYSLIHVHAFDRIVPLIKFLYPRKPLVLHYHGSDIRGKWNLRRRYWSKADFIIVSAPDMLKGAPSEALYLPNPVDTELFYIRGKPEPKTAFHFSYYADDLAKKLAEKYGLTLTIHNREENPIPYKTLSLFLSSYEYYIDVKRDLSNLNLLKEISKTGLEALACGCKVIRWDGSIMEGLPPEHYPEVVVRKLWEIYRLLLRGRGKKDG